MPALDTSTAAPDAPPCVAASRALIAASFFCLASSTPPDASSVSVCRSGASSYFPSTPPGAASPYGLYL